MQSHFKHIKRTSNEGKNQLDIKFKISVSKGIFKKVKTHPTKREKIFESHVSAKGFVSHVYVA